jgi:hypothetical protein
VKVSKCAPACEGVKLCRATCLQTTTLMFEKMHLTSPHKCVAQAYRLYRITSTLKDPLGEEEIYVREYVLLNETGRSPSHPCKRRAPTCRLH